MRRSMCAVVFAVTAGACSGSPTAPAPTTGPLTMRLDAQCMGVQVFSADLFIDGQYTTSVSAGSSYTTTVSIGQHQVEGAAYFFATGTLARHWGPKTVSVPAAGYTELLYCS